MSFKKETKNNLNELNDKKLNRNLNYTFSPSFTSSNTKNPLESISFENEIDEIELVEVPFWNKITFKAGVFVTVVISLSLLLNPFFKKIDPIFFKIASAPFTGINSYFFDQLHKPYVLTVGEYGNLAIAKSEALKLLPVYKQINIKQLQSGLYTFEIERFTSKRKAYKAFSKLEQSGLYAVHVRYLKD